MARLPELDPSALSAGQRAMHDHLLETRGSIPAPHKVWLLNPDLARHAGELGWYLMKQSSLPARLYEMAVLIVARFWDAEYVVQRHAKSAAAAGLAENILSALRDGREPEFTGDQRAEAALFDFVTGVQLRHGVGQDVYDRARDLLGESAVIDLTALIGYIAITSATVKVFELE